MDSVVKELLSDIFKSDSFYYVFINTVYIMSALLLFSGICNIAEVTKSVISHNWHCINSDVK